MTVMYVAFACALLAVAALGVVTGIWQAAIIAFVVEGAMTLVIMLWHTFVGLLVPDHLRGRVAGLDWLITIAGGPLSFAVIGPLASLIGVDATLICAGVLGAVANVCCMLIPGARAPERDGSLAGRDVAAVPGR
jgi:hypothetical protein